VCVIGNVKQWR